MKRYKPLEILYLRYYDPSELEYPYVQIFCSGNMDGYYTVKRRDDVSDSTIDPSNGLIYEAFNGSRWQPIDRHILISKLKEVNKYRKSINLPDIELPNNPRGW